MTGMSTGDRRADLDAMLRRVASAGRPSAAGGGHPMARLAFEVDDRTVYTHDGKNVRARRFRSSEEADAHAQKAALKHYAECNARLVEHARSLYWALLATEELDPLAELVDQQLDWSLAPADRRRETVALTKYATTGEDPPESAGQGMVSLVQELASAATATIRPPTKVRRLARTHDRNGRRAHAPSTPPHVARAGGPAAPP